MVAPIDWIRGDMLGLDLPAHPQSLEQGGPDFLTRAFRAAGAIAADNAVTHITEFRDCPGGSTGKKLFLGVEYARDEPGLHRQLFVKFSRDFDSERRDAARIQMELEVRFALLSRDPNFPIAVAKCYFSDFHAETGTGILITQRAVFGENGVEPHYGKCLDYLMPDQIGHYRAIIRALGRLAGTHKAGKLSSDVERYFPFEPEKLDVSARNAYSPEQIGRRVARYAEFAKTYAHLLPAQIRDEAFIAQLADQAPRFQQMLPAVRKELMSHPDLIALCHWNANIDNAWFWRDEDGAVECGLLDWGNVSQMNLAMALWGCLSAAETDLWNAHLDELLAIFVAEFESAGGPKLDVELLHLHLALYIGEMGLAWMLDAPPLILSMVPDLAEVQDRTDPRLANRESARNQLVIMSNFLNFWRGYDYGRVLEFLTTK
ncbi:hypothetical protein [Haliea sp. E17]|uniref:hypothetical protein n=1 Tax=Haliea sp. E17 TaxID=3401576 RepID=UPI003AAC9EB0